MTTDMTSRCLKGSERLLTACNERLLPQLNEVPLTLQNNPLMVLHCALIYGIGSARAIRETLDCATSLHACALLRSFSELSFQMIWSVRETNWQRYWAAYAHQILEVEKHAKNTYKTGVLSEEDQKSASAATDSVRQMPELKQLIEQVDDYDIRDPELNGTYPAGADPKKFADRLDLRMYRMSLHPATHVSPGVFKHMHKVHFNLEARYFLQCSVNIVRAVHIEKKEPQVPAFWAYNWIARGQADPFENPDISYGRLGLS